MKAAQYNEFSADSNADTVVLTDVPKPSAPKSGHVIVKVHSASLNPADIKVKVLYMHVLAGFMVNMLMLFSAFRR